jgi:hypothetical protein
MYFIDCGVKANEAGALAPSSEALFRKKAVDFLVSLEPAIPETWQGDC